MQLVAETSGGVSEWNGEREYEGRYIDHDVLFQMIANDSIPQ